jgi:hypothetical protein
LRSADERGPNDRSSLPKRRRRRSQVLFGMGTDAGATGGRGGPPSQRHQTTVSHSKGRRKKRRQKIDRL